MIDLRINFRMLLEPAGPRVRRFFFANRGTIMGEINFLAVLLAAVSSFLLGGLWYSPALFGRIWNREAGRGEPVQQGHPAKVFALSFVFALIAATAFAFWIGPKPPFTSALCQGLLAGSCLVAACFGINYQFANRTILLWLIDGGYHTAQFTIFGLVLGLWH
jgi:hypothetical protein